MVTSGDFLSTEYQEQAWYTDGTYCDQSNDLHWVFSVFAIPLVPISIHSTISRQYFTRHLAIINLGVFMHPSPWYCPESNSIVLSDDLRKFTRFE